MNNHTYPAILVFFLVGTLCFADETRIDEIRSLYEKAIDIQNNTTLVKYYIQELDQSNMSLSSWKEQSLYLPATVNMTIYYDNDQFSSAIRDLYSPSGDWGLFQEYYFYESGRLALLLAEYRTFRGNVRIEYFLYFDSEGKEFKRTRLVSDLDTGESIESEEPYFEKELTLYKSIDDLLTSLK